MRKTWKFFSVFGILGSLLPGALQEASATPAAITPPRAQDAADMIHKWGEVREGLLKPETSLPINPEIVTLLENSDLVENLRDVISLSYEMARADEIDDLDALWMDMLIKRGDVQLVSQYLAHRSTLSMIPMGNSQELVDRWIWQANHHVTDCDGNPGNDRPVGGSGESPNGSDYGSGSQGKSS